jgi:RNA polymerase sigma-70 factor (ECF subfamily)
MTADTAALSRASPQRTPSGRIRSGDLELPVAALADFDGVVRQFQRRLFRLFMGAVHDAERADALTQECFLRAWRHRDAYRGDGSLESWLLRIACNLLRDERKSRFQRFWRGLLRFGTERDDDEPTLAPRLDRLRDASPSPEEDLLARERSSQLATAIAALPHRQQMVFRLRFVEELPLAEIAAVLELEVGTVKAHLSRAVAKLRHAANASPAPRRAAP